MFHYSLRVIDEPKMSEIRILNLCHKKTILVDIYRQSLLSTVQYTILTNKERHYKTKIKGTRQHSMRTQDIAITNLKKANNKNQLNMSNLCAAKGSRIHGR